MTDSPKPPMGVPCSYRTPDKKTIRSEVQATNSVTAEWSTGDRDFIICRYWGEAPGLIPRQVGVIKFKTAEIDLFITSLRSLAEAAEIAENMFNPKNEPGESP